MLRWWTRANDHLGARLSPQHSTPSGLWARALCLALSETSERLSHGEPTWFMREKRASAMFADHHHDDRVACWCAASPWEQRARITDVPERFFSPPYVGRRGWLGVWLAVPVDWGEPAEIVAAAFRIVASQRLVGTPDATELR